MMDFFNAEDIKILSRVGHKSFRKGNVQNEQDAQLVKNGPLAKTDYWAEKLAERLPDFTLVKNHHWQRSGFFSSYTWVTICKHQDVKKDIYFTIGVDGEEQSLVYKLDYQFDKTSRLSPAQKEICEKLKQASGAGWVQIDMVDLPTYTWDRLIDEVEKFIRLNEPKYDDMIRQVCCRNARICWNEFSWLYPSGKDGKSSSSNSYERMHGYGNEEWLFDFSKLIDGYHYSFLEPIRQSKNIGGIYDIMLWSVDGQTKKRYAIAHLRNVEIIQEQHAAVVFQQYVQNGWMAEMLEQIKNVGGDAGNFRKSIGPDLFNIRFRPEDVEFLDYMDIPQDNSIWAQNRYVLTSLKTDVESLVASVQNQTYRFNANRRSPSAASSTSPTFYERPARFVELQHLHLDVSNHLVASLEAKYGAANVAQENSIGARRIDVVARTPAGDVFYEIKTYPSLRVSVREAIGQLLEYAFYPDKTNAIKLVVVALGTEKSREYKDVLRYMTQLRSTLKIPIYLILCNNLDFSFSKMI